VELNEDLNIERAKVQYAAMMKRLQAVLAEQSRKRLRKACRKWMKDNHAKITR
jgi:peptidyl-tRNA hydrolase